MALADVVVDRAPLVPRGESSAAGNGLSLDASENASDTSLSP